MLPARPSLPHVSRDTLVLTTLFVLLVLFAWRAERARGVESTRSPSLAACTETSGDDARLACVESAIDARLADAHGTVGDDLRAINSHARTDAWFSRRCHMLMHERGRRHEGAVLPGTIAHDGKDCAAGFLHGWMMEHLGNLDRATVAAWCGPARTALEHADCEHGMGHVLVRDLAGDLPRALDRCRELGNRTFLRNCASGAYMENRFGGQARDDAAPTRFWRVGDPWRPCRAATPRDLLDVCAAWAVRDVDASRRVAWCSQLTAHVDTTPCLVAAGGVASVDTPAATACGEVPACWFGRGFAWAIVGWDHSAVSEAAAGCLEGSGQLRAACARGVGFRRAASIADSLDIAASVSCDHLFSGPARAACHAGAAQRGAPIAYA